MKKKIGFLFALLLMIRVSYVQAQEVKLRIDSNLITIGDAVNMTLSATYNPQQFTVQFPSIADTFNHFEVIERGKTDTVQGRELFTYTQKIRITNFDSGVWMIPAFSFKIKPLQGGDPFSKYTDSLSVQVNTVAVDTSKPFQPIFDIRQAEMPLQQILMYAAAGLLAAVVIAFLIYYFIKKYREKQRKTAQKEPEIIIPPHEKALKAYAELEAQQLWQNGDEKKYHTLLTDIMRTYLEEQFQLDCFEKTSSEIIAQVKRTKALSTSRQQLRQLFETADMVKFAKSKPTAEQHEESLVIARMVIAESYKKIKPVDEPTIK